MNRTMEKLIKLTNSDILSLQISLSELNPDKHSMPLRHQVHYILDNVIKNGRVYVDHWPDYRFLCSLFSSTQFTDKKQFDFDVVTFYQIGTFNDEDLDDFVDALALEREWKFGRSVYANFLQTHWVESFRRILGQNGKFEIYNPMIPYTALERENIVEYKNRLIKLSAALPLELEPDVLRVGDAEQLAKVWNYGPKDVVLDFFEWLIATFPSICLRNKNRQPMAWVGSYSCGAIANLFVDPEYRGRGLSEYLWLSIALKLTDFTRLQPHFFIRPANSISEKSSIKAFPFDLKKGDEVAIWFFFYNFKQFSTEVM